MANAVASAGRVRVARGVPHASSSGRSDSCCPGYPVHHESRLALAFQSLSGRSAQFSTPRTKCAAAPPIGGGIARIGGAFHSLLVEVTDQGVIPSYQPSGVDTFRLAARYAGFYLPHHPRQKKRGRENGSRGGSAVLLSSTRVFVSKSSR